MKKHLFVVSAQVVFTLVAFVGSSAVMAEDTRQYCNEMYPVESYEAEERQQYIAECLQSYGVDEATATAATQTDDEGYYSGTVEDYVETVSESE